MNGRPTDAQAAIGRVLGPLDGERIPGGCDCCDAYRTSEPIQDGIWKVTVHHDDDCPVLRDLERRRAL